MIREIDGEVWMIKRGEKPDWWAKATLDNATGSNFMSDEDIHTSEWKWIDTDDQFHEIIHNNASIDELRHQVLGHLCAIPY
jgi:hypothetical protein